MMKFGVVPVESVAVAGFLVEPQIGSVECTVKMDVRVDLLAVVIICISNKQGKRVW